MSQQFNPENPFENPDLQSKEACGPAESEGLKVEQFFSTAGVHPFDQLEWEKRTAKIAGDDGQAVFEQNDIEVPISWSQLATKVVASKYFYGDLETGKRENSVKQLVHRVARAISDRGKSDGYFASEGDGENFEEGEIVKIPPSLPLGKGGVIYVHCILG